MEIAYYFQKQITLTDRKKLKDFLARLFNDHKTAAISLNIVFCDDEYLLGINRSFLQHDYYTDIITFNLAPKGDNPVEGELYISADRVRDNATLQSVSIKEELHRVIFHGVLHLCGYKDKNKADSAKMREAENTCLARYFK